MKFRKKRTKETSDCPLQHCYRAIDGRKQIRVLVLEPAEHLDDPLVASFKVESLDSKPTYKALSYTWGPPFDGLTLEDQQVTVSGRVISIKGNLGHALRRLRMPDTIEPLWIDALCINQDDLAERGQQVAMMAEIYRIASEVIVWLGEDTKERDGEFVFGIAKHWAKGDRWDDQVARREALKDFGHRLAKNLGSKRTPSQLDENANNSTATQVDPTELVSTFLKRRYFRRRWVVQEVCSAWSVHLRCGQSTASLEKVSRVLYIWTTKISLEKKTHAATQAKLLRHVFNRSMEERGPLGKDHAIQDLLDFAKLECFDPRDKIFALCSMWKMEPIAVDYSLSVEKVFTQFAISLLKTPRPVGINTSTGLAIVLVSAWQAAARVADSAAVALPSWVPDWRLPIPRWIEILRLGRLDNIDEREWLNVIPSEKSQRLTMPIKFLGRVRLQNGIYSLSPVPGARQDMEDWLAISMLENCALQTDRSSRDLHREGLRLRARIRTGDIVGQPCWYASKILCWAAVYRPIGRAEAPKYQIVGVLPVKDSEWGDMEHSNITLV